ncbi:hypothetical protein WA026_012421 [Henosepilachna vigintioctopunctata]|uniref:Kelch domain-containing protein 3 n=1 Tax=Henosepilachna vigintioctopunctata TaxID=420089 RepID=A0AAW1UQ88_9CUCU
MRWITHLEGGPKRVNHAAVAVGHKIYSFGGYCTGENSREYTSMDVHVLNTTTFRWTKHPVSDLPYFENDDILPYKRYGHTAVVYGDKIYIWGGRNDRASCAVLFCFDTIWHCWTAPEVTGNIPSARDGHTACIWNDCMYIFGGFEEESDAFARTVSYLNLKKMQWNYICTSGIEPSVRDFHTTVCINNMLYLFGGRGTTLAMDNFSNVNEIYSKDLWCLDLKTLVWQRPVVSGDLPCGRRSHSAFVYNNKMYIFGGYNALKAKHFNDLFEFNPMTSNWKKVKAIGEEPCERRRQSCVLVGNRLFLFGGTSPLPNYYDIGQDIEDKLVDHSDMHILDFCPSLRTLCMLAIKKNKLEDSSLPFNLRMDLSNMFTPNKINIIRPSSSAG